jgi:hypothetical protein
MVASAEAVEKQEWGRTGWWLDSIFGLFHGRVVLVSFGIALLTYALGLAIAWPIGFGPDYVNTSALYLGVLGIAWTGTFVGWGRHRIVTLLQDVSPAFGPSASEYEEAARNGLRKMLDWRPQAGISLVLIGVSGVYVWMATRTSLLPWFPSSWTSPDSGRLIKNMLLLVYAIPIVTLTTSALVFICMFTRFVMRLRGFVVVPVLPTALATLGPLAGFGLTLSVGWSVGVSLFILLFRPSPTIASSVLVCVLSLVSFVILFAPQYAIHRALAEMRVKLLEAAAQTLAGDVQPDGESLAKFVNELADPRGQELLKVVESVATSRTWAYGYSGLIPLVTPVGLPLGVYVLRAVFGD